MELGGKYLSYKKKHLLVHLSILVQPLWMSSIDLSLNVSIQITNSKTNIRKYSLHDDILSI